VSEAYIVTALPDHLSTIGLKILHDRIGKLNKLLAYASAISENPVSGPSLGGIIFVRVRMGGTKITKAHKRKMADIQAEYGDVVFESHTTEGIGYGEASELALPVFLIDSSNAARVADHYRQIGDELVKRYP
jgi:chromosome partitioning protein